MKPDQRSVKWSPARFADPARLVVIKIEILYRASFHLLDGQSLAFRVAVAIGVQLVLPFLLL
jgi:hypothetical protein